jgi:hypothetical protein
VLFRSSWGHSIAVHVGRFKCVGATRGVGGVLPAACRPCLAHDLGPEGPVTSLVKVWPWSPPPFWLVLRFWVHWGRVACRADCGWGFGWVGSGGCRDVRGVRFLLCIVLCRSLWSFLDVAIFTWCFLFVRRIIVSSRWSRGREWGPGRWGRDGRSALLLFGGEATVRGE